MIWYVIQLFLLVLAAVVLGIIIGCLLQTRRSKARLTSTVGTAAVSRQDTAATAAGIAATADNRVEERLTADTSAAAKIAAEAEAMAKADAEAAARKAAEVEAKDKAKAEAAARKAAETEARAKADTDAAARKTTGPDATGTEAAPATVDAMETASETADKALSDVAELSEEAMAARLADLPKDATPEQKADAVGSRPAGLSAPTGGKADDLKRIRGIGKVNEAKLAGLGIYHFEQVASWSAAEARWVGTFLSFSGRIEREDWIGQAKTLAGGGETAFSKRVDKGEVETSKG